MSDFEGLSNEQIEDYSAGITVAIKRLRDMGKAAEDALYNQKAASYDEYLVKFHRAHITYELINELEALKTKRKEIL